MNIGFEKFLILCEKMESHEHLKELFHFLLTEEEIEKISTRVLLVEALLLEEKSQRNISKDLSISISKITRGSHSLKNISSEFRHCLKEALII